MKWKKLGKIFDPTKYKLPNRCTEYAQSPQVLIFEDYIRIYFSTREKDMDGKYLSHIAFIDMDKNFKRVIKISSHVVIPLGNLGCYDEHGIFPLNILLDENKVLGFIGGWSRRVSVSVETSIGLAISNDNGLTFQKIGEGPVLAASLHEPFLVGDPFVKKFNNVFHMWYIYGKKWITNPDNNTKERIYKIGHAVSSDCISWDKTSKQLIDDRLSFNECQALPTVINYKNKYHMFFCYRDVIGFRENKENAYRIGYAYSEDLINWIRDDEKAGIERSVKGWDSEMQCYPHIFNCDGKIYMLYNGNEFGRYGFGLSVLED